ncbi:hypothetical protein CBX98_23565 [Vibrio sp. T9]|uniref:hypothetical protein n=1 Tax=Vibrio sp. T9 TaxID=2007196 RepID=UPI000D65CAD8|nr:hypothetical protein [Vibrio sp. T9]PWF67616.1 hypothetical protein CBX98_23565 [Vibrio sp. T9]
MFQLKELLKEARDLILAPFLITLVLGGMTLVTPKDIDLVLISVIKGFMQLSGLKLALYTGLLLCGISLLCISQPFLQKVFKLLAISICKCGYSFSIVLTGVCLGLIIPMGLEKMNFQVSVGVFLASIMFIIYAVTFMLTSYFSSQESTDIPDDLILNRIDRLLVVRLLGVILVVMSLICFYFEPWPTVFKIN